LLLDCEKGNTTDAEIGRANALLLVTLLGLTSYPAQPATAQEGRALLPTVVVALGHHVNQVKAHSTLPVRLEQLKDRDALVVQEPNTFVYDHPERGFALPEARYVWIMTALGVVTSLEVSPQVEYLNIDDAFKLSASLIDLFERSGWKKDPAVKVPLILSEIRRKFDDPAADPRLKRGIGRWRNGGDIVHAAIARKHKVGEPDARTLGYTEDKYLITISIENKPLSDTWYNKMIQQRKQDGYDDQRPLSTVGKPRDRHQ
jgi:hypothetical protein